MNDREKLAAQIQSILADELSLDCENGEVLGTGPASYKIADLFLSAPQREAREATITDEQIAISGLNKEWAVAMSPKPPDEHGT